VIANPKSLDALPPWKDCLAQSITSAEELSQIFPIEETSMRAVVKRYPMSINPYYLGLIKKKGDPVYLQAIPDEREISDDAGEEDPLAEEAWSPVPGLTHRYPDRVLFLVSSRCAMYCRFCNRKRKVGRPAMVTEETIAEGLAYIQGHREIRDVLLSGGDPFLLDDAFLGNILERLRSADHVEIIRIGTRVPCTLPYRVTPQLADMLKRFHPLYINTHFNHPNEITPAARHACALLADAGIPMGNQSVLLKGVNDERGVMKRLMQKLLTLRVRPYYLFQADLAKGTSHFWTSVDKGFEILSEIHGFTSGLCVPRFALDLPGGGGKVSLVPDQVRGKEGHTYIFRNYLGKEYRYTDVKDTRDESGERKAMS
jgi:lysine 2,3-aminomutase